MHAPPHPNQVRSACERCRQLKLRCLRQTPTDASCTRCTRLTLPCQAGCQRKVGRPPRKELVRRRQPEEPQTLDLNTDGGMCDTDFRFLDDLANDIVNKDWPASGISPFEFDSFDKMTLPSDFHPLMQEPQPPYSETAVVAASSDVHFQTLSKINVELHGLCNSLFRHAVGLDFESFVCLSVNDFQGMKVFTMIMRTAQEYLFAIKALHKTIGTKKIPPEVPLETPTAATTASSSTSPLASMLDNFYPTPPGAPATFSTPLRSESDQQHPPPVTRTLESPMAFLVISCFVQLIRPLEFVMTILNAYITNTTEENRPPAGDISFADVPIVDFFTQALLAIELIQNTVGQIQLVLGLPSPWSQKSVWTGLISTQKYRDLLNQELGVVEGLWTTRPARLMEMIVATKDVLLESSMTGG